MHCMLRFVDASFLVVHGVSMPAYILIMSNFIFAMLILIFAYIYCVSLNVSLCRFYACYVDYYLMCATLYVLPASEFVNLLS